MRVRALGRRTFDERPTVETMARIGLGRRSSTSPTAIVLGGVLLAVARARRASRDRGRPRSSRALRRARAGCASRRRSPWRPDGGGWRVGTETRIAATDDAARRRFGRYWRLIGPFSSITAARDARRHPAQGRGMRGYLGLGSNVGDRRANLQAAVDALPGHGRDRAGVLVDLRHRPGGRDPRPAVVPQRLRARSRPRWRPRSCSTPARPIERELGRDLESGVRHAPRPIDVDVLLLGDEPYASERLTLPHAQATQRAASCSSRCSSSTSTCGRPTARG